MVAAKRLFSNGVVMIENKCPNTRASNSVGLKSIALLKPNNKLKIISIPFVKKIFVVTQNI